jgi:hypothetical protein
MSDVGKPMGVPPAPGLIVNKSTTSSGSSQTSLLFAGDFYLRPGYSFQDPSKLIDSALLGIIQDAKFSTVNFEGTLAHEHGKKVAKKGPHLALDETAPELLKSIGFHSVTLANNHAMDYGVEALRHTTQRCVDCRLGYVGAGFNSQEAMRSLNVCAEHTGKIQILSFCEREFGVSTGNSPGTAWLISPQAELVVSEAKRDADVVIVCAHGGNELMPLPSPQRRRQLQNLIDAGADLVIGHHPHVPQGWEQYAGRYIFYSLGDFYFDSTDGRRYPYRDWGFMVRANIDEHRIQSLEIVPYERLDDKLVCLGTKRNAQSHLSYLEQVSSMLGDQEFEAYWQQLAVERLRAYRPYIRGAVAYPDITFRERAREALRAAQDLWKLSHFAQRKDQGPRDVGPALGTLNVVRCDSHRWVIETALAVLSGETEDLRSQATKDRLATIEPFYGAGFF